MIRLASFVLVLIATGVVVAESKDHWTQFRGPGARGVVASPSNLPETWSDTENVLWKTDIAGRGWSSPIVWGNRIFLTSVINKGESEPAKKGLYFGGNRPIPESVHEWTVLCLSLDEGQIQWEKKVHQGKPQSAIHVKSSFASETPVTDGEKLYVYFGNLGVYCFDLDGNPIWSRSVKPQKTRFGWGTAASPVLSGDRLYIVNDNEEDSYLWALDKETGEDVWKIPRNEGSNWSTPYIWKHEKRTEIVTPGTDLVRSYDLQGDLLWSLKGMSSITIATPYEYNGLLVVSSGYILDGSKPLYAIRPGAAGDITLKDDATSNEWIAWSQPKAGPYNPSTIAYQDHVYVLYDRGFFAAFRGQDGSEVYSRKRIPQGRAFTSSPWAYNDKLFCLNEDGVTFVIKAGDEFEILRKNALAEDDMCMATPAIVGDKLLIRTAARIYCIK